MITGGIDGLKATVDFKVAIVIPRILETWKIWLYTDRNIYKFTGITILGYSISFVRTEAK